MAIKRYESYQDNGPNYGFKPRSGTSLAYKLLRTDWHTKQTLFYCKLLYWNQEICIQVSEQLITIIFLKRGQFETILTETRRLTVNYSI